MGQFKYPSTEEDQTKQNQTTPPKLKSCICSKLHRARELILIEISQKQNINDLFHISKVKKIYLEIRNDFGTKADGGSLIWLVHMDGIHWNITMNVTGMCD